MHLGLVGLAFAVSSVSASEWSRWRGSNGTSVSDEPITLNPWPASGPAVLWTNAVGAGFSSIAVSQGRIFTLGNSNEIDTVFCLSADTGDILWTNSHPVGPDPDLNDDGVGATPTVDGGRVYTLGKSGQLHCFDAMTGVVQWQKNLTNDFGLRIPTRGFAGSPLVQDEKLILNAGGHGMALNKTNGNLIWLSNTNRCGYSAPVPYTTPEGVRAVTLFSERRAVAARVDTGELLWQHPWSTQFDLNVPDIAVFNGDFLLTSLNRSGTRLNFVGSSAALVWQTNALSTVFSPGVILGNHLYAFSDDEAIPAAGSLLCLDLTDGSVAWSVSMQVGSLLSADNKLIILTGDGELVLAEASPASYVELARARVLQGRCWTMPALSGGKLFCRNSAGDLVALALEAVTPQPPILRFTRATAPDRLRLAWPTNASEFHLETAGHLAPDSLWTNAAGSPTVEGNDYVVESDLGGGGRYFRLRQP